MHGELPDGRELVPGLQASRGHGRSDAALELGVDRRPVRRVDPKAFQPAHAT